MTGPLPPIDIFALRAARSWSTYQLAEYLGCNQSTVWRMENGGNISGPLRKLLTSLRAEIERDEVKARQFALKAERRSA
jgi:transcriptional regulator with XRE-family HTH domain